MAETNKETRAKKVLQVLHKKNVTQRRKIIIEFLSKKNGGQ